MIKEDDRRFAEAAVRRGALTPEAAAKCLARLEGFSGTSFAEIAIISRLLAPDVAIAIADDVKRAHASPGYLDAPARPAPGRPLDQPAAQPPQRRVSLLQQPQAQASAPPPGASLRPPGAGLAPQQPYAPDASRAQASPQAYAQPHVQVTTGRPSSAGQATYPHLAPGHAAAHAAPQAHPPPVHAAQGHAAHAPAHHAPQPQPTPPAPPAAHGPGPQALPGPAASGARKQKAGARTRKIDLTEGGLESFDIRPYLLSARQLGASDVHLTVGRSPFVRLHGHLVELEGDELAPEETERVVMELAGDERAEEIRIRLQGEFLLKDEEGRRYRCCALRHRLGWDLAVRLIRETIPSVDELGLPKSLLRLTEYQQGLVLVTGPGGSGKSSTLAAMLQEINRSREGHIITIEDPVEYVIESEKCHITQRELGRHTESYAKALRAALRENPDVIGIGELRDRETAAIAISAAETGHLVFATLHTGNATRTVASLVDLFPPAQRQQLLTMLSESIRGIICQQLVPSSNRQGRHLALEVLMFTPAVAALVREDKSSLLSSQMQMGRKLGMCRLDDSLEELVRAKKITPEEAYARAESKDRFRAGASAAAVAAASASTKG